MYGYVYETTNEINGKKYIGKHKSVGLDETYKGSGYLLLLAIAKYGFENFTVKVLAWCRTKEELNKEEIYWINYFNAVNSQNYYNIAFGGSGGNTGNYEVVSRKLSEKLSGVPRPWVSKCNIGNTYGKSNKGVPKSDIAKSRMRGPRPSITGANNINYRKGYLFEGERNPNYGNPSNYKMSEENKVLLSEISRNNYYSKEYNLTCRTCNTPFLGKTPNRRYCDSCRGGN